MPRKKETPKPLFSVKHDFVDSMEAFIQASMMLHNALKTVLDYGAPDKPLPESVVAMLRERCEAWEKATLSDQGEG